LKKFALPILFLTAQAAVANPFWDWTRVPKDPPSLRRQIVPPMQHLNPSNLRDETIDVLRVEIKWVKETDRFELAYAAIEPSGTPALLRRSRQPDPLGSYQAVLIDSDSKQPVAYAAIGTGQEYRKLVRAITFRFPVPSRNVEFRMKGENPQTGVMEELVRFAIDPNRLPHTENPGPVPEIWVLHAAEEPKLNVNIYADGYSEEQRRKFYRDAYMVYSSLQSAQFPGVDHLEFRAVFSPSKLKLGEPKELGPIPQRDSYLGLYYPYWEKFGRWGDVVYPTSEKKFRERIGQLPYDYPIVLIDSGEWWGIGNLNAFTAIPTNTEASLYLLLHEFGHFFGLNEEYEEGGPTELAFAPGIFEPWSQNNTFLRDPAKLKWGNLLTPGIPIPTPDSVWSSSLPWASRRYGAYRGGYADTPPSGASHKPGLDCVMDRGPRFCPICQHALDQRIKFDLGNF
jgi:hypothetical protein